MIVDRGYIAVNGNGSVYFFMRRPHRGKYYEIWILDDFSSCLALGREDLPEELQKMSWEDEPVYVEMVCKNIKIKRVDEIKE